MNVMNCAMNGLISGSIEGSDNGGAIKPPDDVMSCIKDASRSGVATESAGYLDLGSCITDDDGDNNDSSGDNDLNPNTSGNANGYKMGVVVDVKIFVDLLAADGSPIKDASSRDLRQCEVSVLAIIQFPRTFLKMGVSHTQASLLEGTVTKVIVESVFIYWIASTASLYGSESATTLAEEQSPKSLKLLSCCSHTNWQLGDYYNFISVDNIEAMGLDRVPNLDENNGNVENNVSLECCSCTSSMPPIHWKRIHRVEVRKDNNVQREEENFEQDGSKEFGLDSATSIPIDTPSGHEFVAEQYMMEKASDDNDGACDVKY
uniref:UBE2O-like tandem tSH3-B domain-containing protein n=1 Tax=Nelumbo nucifera TaxID=4432 RepID=A0A822ZE38_NELNU|nr:TPA_asm: hypothetical protein HUJ06_016018 [Nelumbo nucifera]